MKTQHTAGNWRLHDMEFATVVSPNGRTIAVALNESVSMDECAANARLIAAAPELLAALELAEEQMANEALTAVRMGLHDALRITRAAIAKASA